LPAEGFSMASLKLLAGLCALFLGRRLFWLFVGVLGFALGAQLATQLFREQPHATILIIALTGGVVGAILAYWMQELMIGIVGFLTGSYVGVQFLVEAVPYPGRMIWYALFLGGVLGVLLAVTLFDWAIIVLSSVVGAGLIVEALAGGLRATPVLFLVLAAVGIGVQANIRRHGRRPRRY
jgi:hypothetical protein